MTVYMITYDLKGKDKDYSGVYEAIKTSSTGVWCHYWDSSWLIQSTLTPDLITDKIKVHLDSDDRMIIIEVRNNYQGWMSKEEWDYIRKMFT